MKEFPKGAMVARHPKGLARLHVSPDYLFERSTPSISYDAPGLNKAIIETEGYQRVAAPHSPVLSHKDPSRHDAEVPDNCQKSRLGGFAQMMPLHGWV